MKKIFIENNIPTAAFEIIDGAEVLETFLYPAVVKPVDCNSSNGVVKVANDAELRNAVASAQDISRTGGALVERFVLGEELSVDCFIISGKAQVLCVSRNDKIPSDSSFVISRGYSTLEIRSSESVRIADIAQKIVDAFHLANGPMLIQMLMNSDGLFVVEFSARTGGCTKYRVIELATGIDIIGATIDITLGLPVQIRLADTGKTIVDEFIYCEAGYYDHLEGFDECAEEGLIDGCYPLKWKGVQFDGSVSKSGDRIASIVYSADSAADYENKHAEVLSRSKVCQANGQDMMRRDLLVYTGG
jgi:biotin carboxylase